MNTFKMKLECRATRELAERIVNGPFDDDAKIEHLATLIVTLSEVLEQAIHGMSLTGPRP